MSGEHVAGVEAVLYGDRGCSVVSEDTAGSNAVVGLFGGDDALVDAVLKGSAFCLALAADTARSFGTGNGSFVYTVGECDTGSTRFTADTADACIGTGKSIGDGCFVGHFVKFAAGRLDRDSSHMTGVNGYRTCGGKVFDGTVHLLEHRSGNGHGLAVAVKCTGELARVGLAHGDVCRKIVCTV